MCVATELYGMDWCVWQLNCMEWIGVCVAAEFYGMDWCVRQLNSRNYDGKDFCLLEYDIFLIGRAKLYNDKKCHMNI